jgi:hypothetical protein
MSLKTPEVAAVVYKNGLINPNAFWPFAILASFTSATMPANNGVAAEVPSAC